MCRTGTGDTLVAPAGTVSRRGSWGSRAAVGDTPTCRPEAAPAARTARTPGRPACVVAVPSRWPRPKRKDTRGCKPGSPTPMRTRHGKAAQRPPWPGRLGPHGDGRVCPHRVSPPSGKTLRLCGRPLVSVTTALCAQGADPNAPRPTLGLSLCASPVGTGTEGDTRQDDGTGTCSRGLARGCRDGFLEGPCSLVSRNKS